MTTWRFLRSRGPVAVVIYVVCGIVCAKFTSTDLMMVPLAVDRAVVGLLGPSCLCGIMASVLFGSPDPDREGAWPDHPIRDLRLGWAVVVTLWPVLCAVILTQGSPDAILSVLWFARNHLLLTGMSMIAAVLWSASWAWLPGTVLALLCWFIGTADGVATPRWWALLDYSPLAPGAALVTLVLVVVGLVMQWKAPGESR